MTFMDHFWVQNRRSRNYKIPWAAVTVTLAQPRELRTVQAAGLRALVTQLCPLWRLSQSWGHLELPQPEAVAGHGRNETRWHTLGGWSPAPSKGHLGERRRTTSACKSRSPGPRAQTGLRVPDSHYTLSFPWSWLLSQDWFSPSDAQAEPQLESISRSSSCQVPRLILIGQAWLPLWGTG